MATVGCIFCRLNRSKNRHTPTRIPYSCQLQLGTSGRCVMPLGGNSTCRAIGLPMSQTSRLTMVQNIRRAPPGSFSAGRSTIAEYSARSRGKSGRLEILFLVGFIFRLDVLFGALANRHSACFLFRAAKAGEKAGEKTGEKAGDMQRASEEKQDYTS